MSLVLGVYPGHDAAACLLRDGQVEVMIEEERLTRVKHALPKRLRGLWAEFGGRFGFFPWASLSYCLDAAGVGIDDLDLIALPEDAEGTGMATVLPVRDRSRVWVHDQPDGGAHHFRHALTGFLASPFEQACVLVIDGDGSRSPEGYEAESAYVFHDRQLARWEDVFKNRYPEVGLKGGLGWLYEYVSALLGFVNTHVGYLGQPGKTMGLAPYGGPTPALERGWVLREGSRLDFRPFHDWLRATGYHERLHFDRRDQALIPPAGVGIPHEAKQLAWKAQAELEAAVLGLVDALWEQTGGQVTQLCLAGGVHLNSVANARVTREGPFSRVWIQPAAHDAGQAIGLAYAGQLELARRAAAPPVVPVAHAYGGRTYPAESIRGLLERSGLPCVELADEAALVADAAQALHTHQIVGWFQGGSEYGPRALGHRSILANPRGSETKDRLNARVKFREGFRPFAPAVLAERADEVFELEGESPYMLLVVPVREALRGTLPAITHVDGTARVQTVTAAAAPRFHALIAAFAALSEVPLVLNTSFNLRGMPIVETPRDALRCFLLTRMDALYLDRFKLLPPAPGSLVVAAKPEWRLVIEQELGWGGQQTRARYVRGEGDDAERVELPPVDELLRVLNALDGQRTVAEAAAACWGRQPQVAELHVLDDLVREYLRRGPLELHLGQLVL